tara:strand:- start:239 stop:493 length:255 start_codon:yes stop_codon:yes gene_type:complete
MLLKQAVCPVTGNVGLGLLLVATPAGWIGLIVGGVALAGAAACAVASVGMNNYVMGALFYWSMMISGLSGILLVLLSSIGVLDK